MTKHISKGQVFVWRDFQKKVANKEKQLLGMAISKQYVELMGGTISVESKKGEGSIFTVELLLELSNASKV